jgi:hypothetical protein
MLQGGQSQLFVPLKEGVHEDSYGDDFAISELGLSSTSSWPIATAVPKLIPVIDHHQEDGEDVLPGILGDEVGNMSHDASPLIAGF